MKGGRPARRVVWESRDPPGVEFCTVRRVGTGWALGGTAARRLVEGVMIVSYAIQTDLHWRTKKVSVERVLGGRSVTLELEVKDRAWHLRGEEVRLLRGCTDVDLQVSPATNTIPLKRARPKIGSALNLKAAWVRFPDLKVQPLSQCYVRVGDRKYIYRSKGFESEIELDWFGLVKRYGDYWVAV